ncbi:MAG: hypothetical protein ACTS10_00870 [Kiloniellales bacterium]
MSSMNIDWSAINSEHVNEMLRSAEAHIDAQLQVALASDQRAWSGAAIFIALGVGVLGVTLVYWTEVRDGSTLLSGLLLALGMTSAAFCCMHAGRPVNFHVIGNKPANHIAALNHSLLEIKGYECENYQEIIEENADILAKNAIWMQRGLHIALISPIICVSLYWITFFFS